MRRRRLIVAVAGLTVLACLIGVVLLAGALARIQRGYRIRYDLCVINATQHRLDDVGVYYGTRPVGLMGVIVEGGLKSFGYVTVPIPVEAEVRWREGSVRHAPTVKLAGAVPEGFNNGNIYFVIKPDRSVVVKTAAYDDRVGNQEARKDQPNIVQER